jgi:hypothetical protein
MFEDQKTVNPWRDSNPGSSVLEVDAMTTTPRRRARAIRIFNILINFLISPPLLAPPQTNLLNLKVFVAKSF